MASTAVKSIFEVFMETISLDLGKHSYDIVIRRGVLSEASRELDLDRRVMIVTDPGVPSEYSRILLSQCTQGYVHVIPGGEEHKNLSTMEEALSDMLGHGFSRKDCIVALGGGIPGDLAGYAAASYMRGIDFYNIPTTVLSQVDSSIGGKTAVNLGSVKNIAGAFHQPRKVLIDPDVLATLPRRQISNGLAEAFKMACTFDPDLFNDFLTKDPFEEIDTIIWKSLIAKKNVVEQDEKEMGIRKVLNFGHTIGHGIESTQLGRLYHGECVALGMLPMCSPQVRGKLIEGLRRMDLPTRLDFDEKKVCQAIAHDKKTSGKAISTVYVPEVGRFEFRDMTVEELGALLPLIRG